MKKGEKLSVKQEAFCVAYATNPNATEAAIKAGYSKKTAQQMGSENLLKPLIQQRIDELTAETRSKKIADMKEAQERLTAIARRLETEEFYLPDGSEVSKKAAIRDALKAWELLGRMQGAFLDRSQVEVQGQISVSFVDDVNE